jgi:predicted PurR-regulated permease PerM
MVTNVSAPPGQPEPEASPVQVGVRHLLTLFVWSVILLFFFFFLGPWKLCLLGLLAALSVAALLRPLLGRIPGPRPLKGFLLGLVPIAVCAGLLFVAAWMLVQPIQREMRYLPDALKQFDAWLAAASTRFGLAKPLTLAGILTQLRPMFDSGGLVKGLTGNLVDLAIGIIFVFVGTIYLLAEPSERAIPPLLDLLPQRRRLQAQSAIAALEPRLRWWLIGALITATIIGLTSLLGFWLIGLKLWVPLAILAGISEFVPTIGPACAFLVALVFAATQGADKVLWLCGLYVAVHVLESYVLIPMIYKEAVRVPPIVTLFTVVLWGEVFGIGGLLLAIPINLFLWTMAENFIADRRPVIAAPPATSRLAPSPARSSEVS